MSKMRSLILLVVGASILLLMVHLAGAADVADVLKKADFSFFALALLCEALAILLWALRWRILLSPFALVPVKNTVKGILIGVFFNNVTPVARAGGEPFRAFYMERKEGVSFEDAFATVTIDRILDSIPLMVIITASLAYFVILLDISLRMTIILCIALSLNFILLSVVLYFSFNLKAAKKLMFSILRFVAHFSNRLEKYESRIEAAVEQYHGAVRRLSSQGRDLMKSLSISFTFWFFVILRNYMIVLALGYKISFMAIMVIQTVSILVGIVPFLPGGLGSIDGVMVFLFMSFKFPAAAAVTVSLLDRFISFWLMMGVGAVVAFVERQYLK
ncbi:MAG: flippase-like domain-containing protein [Theionarchaea archaeon]|nr:flippase-like domain-containing protein [Theionarchaea archaeon]MBU7000586.1 flippase-like domain-containing protein [Theionarchaea archaeon]MBU7020488.1 flippase-like domain-containing protein [Theionarchaea archaeon]MBU7034470.1 flippase-like domain-containing protein [Theionarchaea archaeon]MBU7039781.1 flippase-like domain-containing protein [Theionarchaea archaeon]